MSAIPPATHVTVTITTPPGSQLDAADGHGGATGARLSGGRQGRVRSCARSRPGCARAALHRRGARRDRSCMGHTLRGRTLPAEVHEHQHDPEDQRNDHDQRRHVAMRRGRRCAPVRGVGRTFTGGTVRSASPSAPTPRSTCPGAGPARCRETSTTVYVVALRHGHRDVPDPGRRHLLPGQRLGLTGRVSVHRRRFRRLVGRGTRGLNVELPERTLHEHEHHRGEDGEQHDRCRHDSTVVVQPLQQGCAARVTALGVWMLLAPSCIFCPDDDADDGAHRRPRQRS